MASSKTRFKVEGISEEDNVFLEEFVAQLQNNPSNLNSTEVEGFVGLFEKIASREPCIPSFLFGRCTKKIL